MSDLDLGWQLATGRYLVEHHQIPRVELFSYTAQGKEWIYPPFSGAIFYLLYLVGGYSALSWLSSFACAAAVAFLMAAGGRLAAALAIVAVPAIAFRTIPRAELFTTVLFAAVLAHRLEKLSRQASAPVGLARRFFSCGPICTSASYPASGFSARAYSLRSATCSSRTAAHPLFRD